MVLIKSAPFGGKFLLHSGRQRSLTKHPCISALTFGSLALIMPPMILKDEDVAVIPQLAKYTKRSSTYALADVTSLIAATLEDSLMG